jgi:alpha-glucosidase
MTWKRFFVFAIFLPLMHSQWYNGANFYQIYPRSFMDSNGDGIGDLKGIKSKLQYLKDLGIDGVWLSPIYKSPMADFGYDISDFRDIHGEFGTLQDFEELTSACKKIGLRLILDFVPNHSSDEHEWFKKSERRDPGYEDYFIWSDGKHDNVSNSLVYPSNWISSFRFSAWRWSDIRQQFYYHNYHYKQPDLNYRNAKLVQEMKDILTYWMEKGVDGFRIDAIQALFERVNSDGTFPDEPRSYNSNCDRYDECSLTHIYTQDQNETYDMAYQWRALVDAFSTNHKADPKVIMTECYSSISLAQKFYGTDQVKGSHIPFNFELIKRLNMRSTAEDYKTAIEDWLNLMPVGQMANWVVS